MADRPTHLRPREKLFTKGSQALTAAELVAILLRTGYPGRNALELAHYVLHKYPLSKLEQIPLATLAALKGMGTSRAATLHAALALSHLVHNQGVLEITSPALVYNLVQSLSTKKQEHLVGLYLNARHQLLHQQTISIGTISSNLIHPREVFAPALHHRASGIIVVHNHPSGDTRPSREDLLATEKLVEAGELLDIPVLDHLIVGHHQWLSFKQEKLL